MRGRVEDTNNLVSAALSDLKSQDRVVSLGRGIWVASEFAPNDVNMEELLAGGVHPESDYARALREMSTER